MSIPNTSQATADLLAILLTPGIGPIRAARLIEALGSASEVRRASPAHLKRVKGIGEQLSRSFAEGLRRAEALVQTELELAEKLGVHLVALDSEAYPPLLRTVHAPPPLLYVKGRLDWTGRDRFPVAIVGSRECTHYGIEQSERFAGVLASAGLTIVSGGARGIDSAAHRGAMRSGGGTMAVLGCGLAHAYPPENVDLFETISRGDAANPAGYGAVVSELPLNTPPASENFPARNRLISGMSLGVLVIEAGLRSGALITAKIAAEDHGRDVMALPGRVDSRPSAGSLDLLKNGGAALVTDPGDVLAVLESAARHLHRGTHEARFSTPETDASAGLFDGSAVHADIPSEVAPNPAAAKVLAALDEPRTMDELVVLTALAPGDLMPLLTMLEIQRRIARHGPAFRRRG